jgi:sialic acid synthase SpsE
MSLEPHELKPFVDDIRRIEKARGSPDAIFIYKIGLGVRRSLAAKRGIKKGQALREEDLDFRRPGLSIPADRWKEIIGKKAKKDIAKGEFLKEDML